MSTLCHQKRNVWSTPCPHPLSLLGGNMLPRKWLLLGLFLFFQSLLFIVFVITVIKGMLSYSVSILNSLPWGICPSAWILNLSTFVQLTGRHSDPAHLQRAREKEVVNTSPPRGWPSQEKFCKIYGLFTLLPHLLPLTILEKKLASTPLKTVL